MSSKTKSDSSTKQKDGGGDPDDSLQRYTMSHFARALGETWYLEEVLERVGAPAGRLYIIQESECSLLSSTFKNIDPYDVATIVLGGEGFGKGLDGDQTAEEQKKILEDQGIDADSFPLLSPGEDISVACGDGSRYQVNDTDAEEFCKKYGITDDEWDTIVDYVDGEGSTDNVYLELVKEENKST
jgi:hypothetical protein